MPIILSMFQRAIPRVFALLALAGAPLCAQQYSFRTFGVGDGLDNLAIRTIYQDRTGFLWVSTENGIFRYDGDRFESFATAQGVPPNSGVTFGDAPDGSLLIGGSIGLYHLVGNRFENLPGEFKSINFAQGIAADGKGHTFAGTDGGLLELAAQPGEDGFSMRMLPLPPGTTGAGAYGVFADGDAFWYGCGDQLCRMDAQGTTVYGQENGLPGHAVIAIQKDHAGNLWAHVRNAGVFVRPAGKARFEQPVLPFSSVTPVGIAGVDRDGRILLTTAEGLLIGDEKGWQKIDRSVGLRGAVYSALEDRQHSLWIGLAGLGLAQWRGYREWESYSNDNGLTSDIAYELLQREDGSLWVGTEAGLLRGERRQFGMAFKPVQGMMGFAVHSVQQAKDGSIWIGTESRGVARMDARTLKPEWFGEAQGLFGKAAYTLRFDHEQRLWAATDAGLFVATPPYQRFARVTQLPAKRFWAIAEGTDGTLWAGGAEGLFESTLSGWKRLTRANGLSNQEVLALGAGPNAVLWVGYRYGGGIDRVHPRPGGVTIEKGVQRNGTDGLIYFLDFDATGRLWVGTQRGVDMWDGAHWSHYDMQDGLAWDDCNLNSFAAEPDGTVWIGTSGGLSRFKPRPHSSPDAPPEVVFTRLAMGETDVSGLHDPSFRIHDNSLVARYSALNASRGNGVNFRYRLGGASSNWTETTERELHFANLAPGAYRLEVAARQSDGEWSGRTAEFSFHILTPWYLTWWFATLCVLIPLSLVAGLLRLRFLSAKRRERELILLVERKTADLIRANQDLQRLSYSDPLTGLANRRSFDGMLERECARLRRSNSMLSLLCIDADHFKAVNDSQGHQKGDEYLIALGAELTRLCRRQVDLAARTGGEEFAMILPETGSADAERFAESVRVAIEALRLPHPASPVFPFLTVSVGVATASRNWCGTRDCLAAAADRALYAAKKSGRNRVCVAPREAVAEQSAPLVR
jgi:diguanylate cyclase (GGDEF)-like protein